MAPVAGRTLIDVLLLALRRATGRNAPRVGGAPRGVRPGARRGSPARRRRSRGTFGGCRRRRRRHEFRLASTPSAFAPRAAGPPVHARSRGREFPHPRGVRDAVSAPEPPRRPDRLGVAERGVPRHVPSRRPPRALGRRGDRPPPTRTPTTSTSRPSRVRRASHDAQPWTRGDETLYWFGDNDHGEWAPHFDGTARRRTCRRRRMWRSVSASADCSGALHVHGPGFSETIVGRALVARPHAPKPRFDPNALDGRSWIEAEAAEAGRRRRGRRTEDRRSAETTSRKAPRRRRR